MIAAASKASVCRSRRRPVNIDHAAAIAKAVTGAYLSSEGNAFSTRTASQIVQEHFNPREELSAGRAAVRRAVQLSWRAPT